MNWFILNAPIKKERVNENINDRTKEKIEELESLIKNTNKILTPH